MNGIQKLAKQTWGNKQEAKSTIERPRTLRVVHPPKSNLAPGLPGHAFRAWSEITRQIHSAPLCALLLDFDGTLVKIQRRPWHVRVPQRTKLLLQRLSQHPNLFVAIVSGRRCQDLQTRIGIEALHFIGLHGAEEDGKSVRISKEAGRILAAAKGQALERTASMKGIRIEDKNLSFAVHYREAKPLIVHAAKSCLLELVAPLNHALKMFEGAMVWEVLPHEIRGKGIAARTLLSRLPRGTPAVYIGDDGTDEFAFRALSNQITIRVGKTRESHARYYLRNVSEVIDFLLRLEAQLP